MPEIVFVVIVIAAAILGLQVPRREPVIALVLGAATLIVVAFVMAQYTPPDTQVSNDVNASVQLDMAPPIAKLVSVYAGVWISIALFVLRRRGAFHKLRA
jgi:hypothetical protein